MTIAEFNQLVPNLSVVHHASRNFIVADKWYLNGMPIVGIYDEFPISNHIEHVQAAFCGYVPFLSANDIKERANKTIPDLSEGNICKDFYRESFLKLKNIYPHRIVTDHLGLLKEIVETSKDDSDAAILFKIGSEILDSLERQEYGSITQNARLFKEELELLLINGLKKISIKPWDLDTIKE